jgi:hypothetical protein
VHCLGVVVGRIATVGRGRRRSVALEIDGPHLVMFGESRNPESPLEGASGEAVQEHDGTARLSVPIHVQE